MTASKCVSKLSPHFTLSELTVTSTGLPNEPDEYHLANLIQLCRLVLEPWRERTGALRVTSGFRSTEVNRAVGGSARSQHLKGEAVDVSPLIVSPTFAWVDLDALARGTLPVDQAIIYQRKNRTGWIHVSFTARYRPRRQFLVQPLEEPGKYVPYETFSGPLEL